jgi:hypothetical protein
MNAPLITDSVSEVLTLCAHLERPPSKDEVKRSLKRASLEMAQAVGWLQKTYTVTTVADTATYKLPSDCTSVLYVLWDNYRMGPIGWDEWSKITGDGQLVSSADPIKYLVWGSDLVLEPAPSTAKTLTIYYLAKPTLRVRDYEAAATGGSTTTVVDTNLPAKFGIVNNRLDADTDFFNGCRVLISQDAGGSNAAPENETSIVTGYNESSGTLTVSPAFSAAVAASDYYKIQDALEVPAEWVWLAEIRAALRFAGRGKSSLSLQESQRLNMEWMSGFSQYKAKTSRVLDTGQSFRLQNIRE